MAFRFAIWASTFILGATAVAALAGSSAPDLARQHYERRDCHLAYDLIAETAAAGRSISAAERDWGVSYEKAGEAGKPCPAPPDALLQRATNQNLNTIQGLGRTAQYLKQNDPSALLEIALKSLQGGITDIPPAQGFELLKKAADLGEPHAQYQMAFFHYTGTNTAKDPAAALRLMESAAKAGHVDAMYQAGNFYKEGIGAKKDLARAFAYYGQAAERGHVFSAYLAFYMVQDGDGTKKDFKRAYTLARNMADQGEVYGAVLAASALLQQKDAKTHEDEVLYWMDYAAKNGDADIRGQIGKMRPQVVAAFKKANAPPEYVPRVRKICPMKTVCLVDRFSGLQRCTTNKDYWNDCDL